MLVAAGGFDLDLRGRVFPTGGLAAICALHLLNSKNDALATPHQPRPQKELVPSPDARSDSSINTVAAGGFDLDLRGRVFPTGGLAAICALHLIRFGEGATSIWTPSGLNSKNDALATPHQPRPQKELVPSPVFPLGASLPFALCILFGLEKGQCRFPWVPFVVKSFSSRTE
jgi:hypothetical protein